MLSLKAVAQIVLPFLLIGSTLVADPITQVVFSGRIFVPGGMVIDSRTPYVYPVDLKQTVNGTSVGAFANGEVSQDLIWFDVGSYGTRTVEAQASAFLRYTDTQLVNGDGAGTIVYQLKYDLLNSLFDLSFGSLWSAPPSGFGERHGSVTVTRSIQFGIPFVYELRANASVDDGGLGFPSQPHESGRLAIQFLGVYDSAGNLLANVAPTSVPEPASVLLGISGLGLLTLLKRRG